MWGLLIKRGAAECKCLSSIAEFLDRICINMVISSKVMLIVVITIRDP